MSRAYTDAEFAQGLEDLRRYVAAAVRGRIPPMTMVKRNQVNTDMINAAKAMPKPPAPPKPEPVEVFSCPILVVKK